MNLNGIQAGHCVITPTCRENLGEDAAWVEACLRLQRKYEKLCRRPDIDLCDIHLALALETPRHKEAAGSPAQMPAQSTHTEPAA